MNHENEEDESLTLRIAIQYGNIELFMLLWDSYPLLYTEKHLMDVTRFAIFLRKQDFLLRILTSSTTNRIFLNTPLSKRIEFVDIFDEKTLSDIW
jgi:hypothetical protein